MNKILVKLYIPLLEVQYDVLVPVNKKVHSVIKLFIKAINELNGGYYTPKSLPMLYNKVTTEMYNINLTIKENNMQNGEQIIML